MSPNRQRRSIRRWSPLAALTAAVAMMMMAASSAHAATVDVIYDASGSTHIASTDSTIELGPTTLAASADISTGEMTGSMDLPGTTTRFELAGFIPVTADVSFEETAPATGVISAHPDGGGSFIEATASYHIRLSNIKIVGFPTFAGPFCRTKEPVTIDLATPEGERFDLFAGGRLTGEYSIGDFQHCGLNTWLINTIIPGSGNTIDFNLSNGRAG